MMATALPSLAISALLICIAFFGGIGCTTIGPGGIFTTIALYTFTALSSSSVAGTAQLTFIGVGLIGSVAYLRSGELAIGGNAWMAAILSVSSVLGAFIGVQLNTYVSRDLFGLLLGFFAVITGFIIFYRERSTSLPNYEVNLTSSEGIVLLGILGLGLGVVSGLLGVGGPVIAVPVLVVLGIKMLPAVAVAQVQSIFIATFATVGYVLNDAVSVPLALLIGIPQLIGAVVGWQIAQHLNPARLKTVLSMTLIVIGPYLMLQ